MDVSEHGWVDFCEHRIAMSGITTLGTVPDRETLMIHARMWITREMMGQKIFTWRVQKM